MKPNILQDDIDRLLAIAWTLCDECSLTNNEREVITTHLEELHNKLSSFETIEDLLERYPQYGAM